MFPVKYLVYAHNSDLEYDNFSIRQFDDIHDATNYYDCCCNSNYDCILYRRIDFHCDL